MSDVSNLFDQPPVDLLNRASSPGPRGPDMALPVAFVRPLNALALAVVFLTLASVVPGGSAHPTPALVATTGVFLVAGLFVLATKGQAFGALAPFRNLLVLGVALVGFGLWQSLPFGTWAAPSPAGTIRLQGHSLDPGATLLAALRLAGYVTFFALVLHLGDSKTRAERIGRWLFLGVVAQAAYALVTLHFLGDTFLGHPKSAYTGLATGTFVNRNTLATYLGMGLVLGLALLGSRRMRRARSWMYWVGIALIFVALLSTQSRMGLAATLVAAIVTFGSRIRPTRTTALIGVVLIGVLFVAFGQGLADRLLYVGMSGQTRAEFYAQILTMIRAVPLTGYGLDSFPLAYEMYHAPPVTAAFVWDRAHSTYLTYWAECGVLAGSIVPLAGAMALRRLFSRGTPSPMQLAGRAALILAGLHSLIDFSLEIPAVAYLLLALTALGMCQTPPDQKYRKDVQR